MAATYGILFRVLALTFFIYIFYYSHNVINGGRTFSLKDFSLLLRFLTILTILLQIVYYAFATPLQYCNMHKTHSAMYALVFTADLIVCILFWGIFMVDKGLLANESELKALPSWYNHSSHTVGIVAIIIDALLWKPASLPISSSILLIVTYFGGYVLYVEYLIRVHNLYPYPILANFSESGRFGFFGVIIIGIALCFGVSILIVRSLNKIPRKKMTTKSHQRLEKKEVTAVQSRIGYPFLDNILLRNK